MWRSSSLVHCVQYVAHAMTRFDFLPYNLRLTRFPVSSMVREVAVGHRV